MKKKKDTSKKIKLLSVIPIVKSAFYNSAISYFTSKDVKEGSLVYVTLRNRKVPAIVKSATELKDKKIALKSASFKLKNISGVLSGPFLTRGFIDAVEKISRYYVASSGTVFKQIIPERILKKGIECADTKVIENSRHFHQAFIQMDNQERIKQYKSIIRESFARKESVFLIMPTVNEVENAFAQISKGIEDRVVMLHGELKPKQFDIGCSSSINVAQPIVIMGTFKCLFIPRDDVGTLIVDHESSSAYIRPERPFLDVRRFSQELARESKMMLIFGDVVLTAESYFKSTTEISSAATRSNLRIESRVSNTIFYNKKNDLEKFSSVSEDLRGAIEKSVQNSEKSVLFVSRKGLSTMTFCRDCSSVVLCPNCSSPLVLYSAKNKKNEFACNRCFVKTELNDKCPRCSGWKLSSYGFGTQKVEDDIKKYFPDANIFRLDGDSARTKSKVEEIIKAFNSSEGGILIATELFFSAFNGLVDNVFVVSIDNLFTIPDFRISEKIFRTILSLRSRAKKRFGIQTRISDNKIFDYAISGNLSGFYKDELTIRKQLEYPPFKMLIKITKKDKDKKTLLKDISDLKIILKKYEPLDFPAFISRINNIYIYHILLKLSPEGWPDSYADLENILSSLGPQWIIRVNPDNIL